MIIRRDQLNAISSTLDDQFVRRSVARLLTAFPGELAGRQLTRETLEPLVKQACADARSYGVASEGALNLYLDCVALLGPGFDRAVPWAARILEAPQVPGDQKMLEINDHLIFGADEPR